MDKHIKSKPRTRTLKERATHRVKIMQGHLQSIEQMLEADRYCIDVINQSKAIQKSLQSLDALLLEDHLKSCTIEHLRADDPEIRDKALLELLEVYGIKKN